MKLFSVPIAMVSCLLFLSACSDTTDQTSQDQETGGNTSVSDLPEDTDKMNAMTAAKSELALRLQVDADSIDLLQAEETEWSDSCLGLGGPAESCLAAITPGYSVVMSYEGTEYRYRTNIDGSVVRAE